MKKIVSLLVLLILLVNSSCSFFFPGGDSNKDVQKHPEWLEHGYYQTHYTKDDIDEYGTRKCNEGFLVNDEGFLFFSEYTAYKSSFDFEIKIKSKTATEYIFETIGYNSGKKIITKIGDKFKYQQEFNDNTIVEYELTKVEKPDFTIPFCNFKYDKEIGADYFVVFWESNNIVNPPDDFTFKFALYDGWYDDANQISLFKMFKNQTTGSVRFDGLRTNTTYYLKCFTDYSEFSIYDTEITTKTNEDHEMSSLDIYPTNEDARITCTSNWDKVLEEKKSEVLVYTLEKKGVEIVKNKEERLYGNYQDIVILNLNPETTYKISVKTKTGDNVITKEFTTAKDSEALSSYFETWLDIGYGCIAEQYIGKDSQGRYFNLTIDFRNMHNKNVLIDYLKCKGLNKDNEVVFIETYDFSKDNSECIIKLPFINDVYNKIEKEIRIGYENSESYNIPENTGDYDYDDVMFLKIDFKPEVPYSKFY